MSFLAIVWDPSLGIDLGFFTIRHYSLMFLTGFLSGHQVMKRIYAYEKIELKKAETLLMCMLFSTVFGARLGHVFFYDWEYFKDFPEEILLPFKFRPDFQFVGFSGLSSHGAMMMIIFSLWFYAKRVLNKSLLYILDRTVIGTSCAGIFIRLGNLMNSEIIGYPTNNNYGFIFAKLGESFPRHPAQLYESFGCLIVFLVTYTMYRRWKASEKEGLLFGTFLVLLWSMRFFIEFFKEPQVLSRESWILNTGQLLSIPCFFVGIYFIVKAKKSSKKSITDKTN